MRCETGTPKIWSLEIDYSKALCLSADQKTPGLWERDLGENLQNVQKMCFW